MRDRWHAFAAAALAATGIFALRQARQGHGSRVNHRSETRLGYAAAPHKILILGAGFGGLAAALRLDARLRYRDDASVLVVDRDSALLFTPLLWTVADGRADPNDVVVP